MQCSHHRPPRRSPRRRFLSPLPLTGLRGTARRRPPTPLHERRLTGRPKGQ